MLQPNVIDLNKGEIWVQKWIRAEKANEDQHKLDQMIAEIQQRDLKTKAVRKDSFIILNNE